jgi:hypothetical protein
VFAYAGSNPQRSTDKNGLQSFTWGHGDRHFLASQRPAVRLEIQACIGSIENYFDNADFSGRTPSGVEYRGRRRGNSIYIGTHFPVK